MIKNLIFDFGAVLIPIDESRSSEAFEKLGALPSLGEQQKLFRKIETGKISREAFLEELKGHFFRKKIFKADIAAAWNALCYHPIPEESLQFIKYLKSKGFRLFLLSNTNALHIEKIRQLSGPFIAKQFYNQFEKVYFSHEVKLRKPDKAIYELLLKENELDPAECFFTDDKKENVRAAAKLGLKTYQFNPESDRLQQLKKHFT